MLFIHERGEEVNSLPIVQQQLCVVKASVGDKEDDRAYIFNIYQKRPNTGCRDKISRVLGLQ